MANYMQIIEQEVQQHISTIANQAKQGDEMLGNLRGLFNPIQGGAWRGQSADAFKNFMLTKYMPEVIKLIAAIAGIGGGVGQGLGIFEGADGNASSQVSGVLDQLNVF